MFISSVNIKNYRLFPTSGFDIKNINIPDGKNEGSGLTVFVGENGCGKTSLLEAVALPLLSYKADRFTIDDLNDPESKVEIEIIADSEFKVDKTVPKGDFNAKGFLFEAGVRTKGSSSYLSSLIVSDQKFIQADAENIKEYSPDLRVNVNNPYKGPRFKENDILFLDRNRTFQIRSGTYNQTRFDRLMEDFDSQYFKEKEGNLENLSSRLDDKIKTGIQNEFLKKSINRFKEITGIPVNLEIINNYRPFQGAFLGEKRSNNLQIQLNKIGSGYEMGFALLYSFYLAEQSGKQLIILLDELELHLHPSLQKKFVDIILEMTKTSQIILSSQSPLFVKQLSANEFASFNVLKKTDNKVELAATAERALPTPSANEINYIAFNLSTFEYHNELYGHLHELYVDNGEEEERGNRSTIDSFDKYLISNFDCDAHTWKRPRLKDGSVIEESRTLHTCIRNKWHHPDNNLNNSDIDFDKKLDSSISFLRNKILEINNET